MVVTYVLVAAGCLALKHVKRISNSVLMCILLSLLCCDSKYVELSRKTNGVCCCTVRCGQAIAKYNTLQLSWWHGCYVPVKFGVRFGNSVCLEVILSKLACVLCYVAGRFRIVCIVYNCFGKFLRRLCNE